MFLLTLWFLKNKLLYYKKVMVSFNKLSQYGLPFQLKVINQLLTNKEFLLNIRDTIQEEYFDNSSLQWIVTRTLKYFDYYHTSPTLEALQIEVKKLDNDLLKTNVIEQLRESYRIENSDVEYVREEFSNFCKNQQLKKALLTSVDLLNSGMYDDIRSLIDSALKAGMDKNIGHEYSKDVESRYRPDARQIVPTPWEDINKLLMGGLGGGDLGLVFGNPGGGKSWMMVAVAGHAVKLGFNVVYYTLELGEVYVGKRFDAFFVNEPVNQIHLHRKKTETEINRLEGKLVVKEFSMGKATIQTLESHIQKLNDMDLKPDLIIIDYIDLLRSPKRSADRKDEIDDVYVATKGLARDLNIPIWSVSQVNRAGAQDDIIQGDKAAGSYDKIMISDFCLSLSRKKEDKVNGTGRLHVMKNRYGMDGLTYNAKVDTTTGHIDLDDNNEGVDIAPTKTFNQSTKPNDWDNSDIQKLRNKLSDFSNSI
jgi:archaellum biogenesis ATPase FlaH